MKTLLALLLTACTALAQTPAPAFRGTLPMGKDTLALFELPGGSSWTGKVGETVPGTKWTLRAVNLRPTAAVVQVGGAQVSIGLGETYLGGAKATPAPLPTAAQAAAPRRVVAPPVRYQQPRFTANVPAATAPVAQPADEGPPPNYAQVDASGDKTRIHEYGVYGQQTLVMFTSIRCGPCQRTKPFVKQWARAHPEWRVVEAEIGASANNGINWAAPVVSAAGIRSVPWFVMLDAQGHVTAQGEAAKAQLNF